MTEYEFRIRCLCIAESLREEQARVLVLMSFIHDEEWSEADFAQATIGSAATTLEALSRHEKQLNRG